MNRTKINQIILGNIDASTAPAKTIDTNGLFKILHAGFLVIASSFITFLIANIGGLDLFPNSGTDEMIITALILPTLKFSLTYFANNSTS